MTALPGGGGRTNLPLPSFRFTPHRRGYGHVGLLIRSGQQKSTVSRYQTSAAAGIQRKERRERLRDRPRRPADGGAEAGAARPRGDGPFGCSCLCLEQLQQHVGPPLHGSLSHGQHGCPQGGRQPPHRHLHHPVPLPPQLAAVPGQSSFEACVSTEGGGGGTEGSR